MTQQDLYNIFRAIQRHFNPDDSTGSMTAAKVGVVLRQVFGSPQHIGFLKLKDLLGELEQNGLIRTGTNSKDAFAIWLTEPKASHGESRVAPDRQVPRPIRRLRRNVWHAFVAASPEGGRYLNRRTGEVRLGLLDSPEPIDDWVKIDPLSPEAEKDDARDFLKNHDVELSVSITDALESPIWYVQLPNALDQSIAFQWKRHRSCRVVEHVEEWRQRHGVEHDFVYDVDTRRTELSPSASQKDLRETLLAALSRMSTDELLSLTMPARHLIAVLRPDLLRR